MVQRTSTEFIKSTIKGTLLRVLFLFAIIPVSYFLSNPFIYFIEDIAKFRESPGFFGVLYGFETFALGVILSFVFWSSIIFNALGKKVDYILSAVIFLLSCWLFFSEEGSTSVMYIGLVGFAAFGSVIGYILKLLRQRYWK